MTVCICCVDCDQSPIGQVGRLGRSIVDAAGQLSGGGSPGSGGSLNLLKQLQVAAPLLFSPPAPLPALIRNNSCTAGSRGYRRPTASGPASVARCPAAPGGGTVTKSTT